MKAEMEADINAAVGNLRSAFSKHGLEEPAAIVLGSDHNYRVLRSFEVGLTSNQVERLRDEVACKIGGMPLLRP